MPVLDRVDPELLAAVKELPILDLSDIPAARLALHEIYRMIPNADPNPAIERSDHLAPGIGDNPDVMLRMFRPKGLAGDLPLLYWIQGGGYVLTALDLDDAMCEEIAMGQQCAVLSVLWRRAPEHPFPAASDDCYAGMSWAFRSAAALRIDPTRVVVGGASSGGGAAAALALQARDRGEFRIAHQLLVYPMLDDTNSTPSSHAVTDPELWNRASNEFAWRAYLGNSFGSSSVSPYAAPMRMVDLAGVAAATILTAELDMFVDENIIYAQRLMHAGVATELHVYPAAIHGFEGYNPASTVSRRYFADRDAALKRAFGTQRQ